MPTELETMLSQYDAGQMSRRELLSALALLLLPASSPTMAEPRIGLAKRLNHVTVYVRDVGRAQSFYQTLFGMPVRTQQAPGVNLSCGDGFLGLYPAGNDKPGRIDHFCLGLARFDAETTKRKLVDAGIDAAISQRGDTKELYFTDPDGIDVQLQDVRYRGGVGPVGDRNPT